MKKFRSRRDREGIRKYDDARWEFLKLLEKQEIYWKQRSKQFWLREGDQNTKFFHNYATGRKKRNQIKKLKDKNGVWKENKDELQQIITEYFEDLFKASGVDGSLSDREVVNHVTLEQNQRLMRPVNGEEVQKAVFDMHPDKSPGVDGLNPGFFQAYWQIVGRDVTKLCQDFFATGELPVGINRTLVCLIPKVQQPQNMTELRPISLCNVLI